MSWLFYSIEESLNKHKGCFNVCLLIVLVCLFTTPMLGKPIEDKDSLECIRLSERIAEMDDSEDWMKLNKRLIEITSRKMKKNPGSCFYKKQLSYAVNNLGFHFLDQGKFVEAKEKYSQAFKLQKECNDTDAYVSTMWNTANLYRSIGDYRKAFYMWNQCLAIMSNRQDFEGIAQTYNSMGLLYHELNNDSASKRCYNVSKKIYEREGNEAGLATVYNNLASHYASKKDSAHVMELYFMSLEIYKKTGVKIGEAQLLNNIGKTYSEYGYKDLALSYLTQSLKLLRDIKAVKKAPVILANLAKLLNEKGKAKEALSYAKEAYNIALDMGAPEALLTTTKALSEIYAGMKNTAESERFEALNLGIKDSLDKETHLRDIMINKARHQLEGADDILVDSSAEKSNKKENIKATPSESKNNNLSLWWVLFPVLGAMAFAAYKILKHKK